MATAARARILASKETTFLWEGKNRDGKTVRGEIRAASEAVVQASEDPEAFDVVAVAFASTEGLPGMRAPRVGDVFQWRASEFRRRTGVQI